MGDYSYEIMIERVGNGWIISGGYSSKFVEKEPEEVITRVRELLTGIIDREE